MALLAPGTLTAANSVFMLSITGLYTTPQQLQGYAADDAFEVESVDNKEILIGVDAQVSAGWVPVLSKMSITFMANSPSITIFDNWYQTENTNQEVLVANGNISIPGTSQKFTLTGGYLSSYTPMPPVKKILNARKHVITWAQITAANQ